MRCNFIVSLSVGGDTQSQSSSGQTDTDGSSSSHTRSQSPALLTVSGGETQTANTTVHSASPTLHAVQQMESGVSSRTAQPAKDGGEMKYQRYASPHKQSRSFQMLEQGLKVSEAGQGVFACVRVST